MPVTRCIVEITIDSISQVVRGPSNPKDVFFEESASNYSLNAVAGVGVPNEWSDYRSILTAGNDDIDLSGSLSNTIKELQVFRSVSVLYIKNTSAVSNLTIGGGSNPAPLFAGTIGPGGKFLYDAGITSPGKTITPGTADMLRVTSDASDASYAIYIGGVALYDPASAALTATSSLTATPSLAIAAIATISNDTGISAAPALAVKGAASLSTSTGLYAAPSLTTPS